MGVNGAEPNSSQHISRSKRLKLLLDKQKAIVYSKTKRLSTISHEKTFTKQQSVETTPVRPSFIPLNDTNDSLFSVSTSGEMVSEIVEELGHCSHTPYKYMNLRKDKEATFPTNSRLSNRKVVFITPTSENNNFLKPIRDRPHFIRPIKGFAPIVLSESSIVDDSPCIEQTPDIEIHANVPNVLTNNNNNIVTTFNKTMHTDGPKNSKDCTVCHDHSICDAPSDQNGNVKSEYVQLPTMAQDMLENWDTTAQRQEQNFHTDAKAASSAIQPNTPTTRTNHQSTSHSFAISQNIRSVSNQTACEKTCFSTNSGVYLHSQEVTYQTAPQHNDAVVKDTKYVPGGIEDQIQRNVRQLAEKSAEPLPGTAGDMPLACTNASSNVSEAQTSKPKPEPINQKIAEKKSRIPRLSSSESLSQTRRSSMSSSIVSSRASYSSVNNAGSRIPVSKGKARANGLHDAVTTYQQGTTTGPSTSTANHSTIMESQIPVSSRNADRMLRSAAQDVTVIKTMLLRLQRHLQGSNVVSPLESPLNGLDPILAFNMREKSPEISLEDEERQAYQLKVETLERLIQARDKEIHVLREKLASCNCYKES